MKISNLSFTWSYLYFLWRMKSKWVLLYEWKTESGIVLSGGGFLVGAGVSDAKEGRYAGFLRKVEDDAASVIKELENVFWHCIIGASSHQRRSCHGSVKVQYRGCGCGYILPYNMDERPSDGSFYTGNEKSSADNVGLWPVYGVSQVFEDRNVAAP